MVDTSKPLLQDRPPAYNTVPGTYDYGGGGPGAPGGPPPPQASMMAGPPLQQQGNYGAIPPAQGGYHQAPPPPYQYPPSAGPGYPTQAISQQPYSPHQQQTYTIIQPSVVVVGGCPACRVGVLEDDFTCLGIMCAIFFFPLGILFCFALRQRRCPNCGATFG